ncbi:MAG: hypothetical protein PHF31_16315, partial [Methylobacter sp.]|nr:hypothetical protein [Methylobacter sp.]
MTWRIMGFFSKSTDKDKWKEKYLKLLAEHDQAESVYKKNEELLFKTIIRLSVATAGLDPLLDLYLHRIRDHLKRGIDNHTLKTELDDFTSAVTQIQNTAYQIQSFDASLLFDFLFRQYTTETLQSSLHQLKERSEQNKFATPDQLFIAILEAIEAEYVDHTTSASIRLANYIDTNIISKQLLLLLEGIEIPGALDQQAKTVKQLLATSNQLPTAFETILDQSVNLLLKIK